MRLLGYLDRLSVNPGEPLAAKISADGEYDSEIVRLHNVDVATDTVRETVVSGVAEGRHAGRTQPLRPGSFAFARSEAGVSFSSFGFDLWVQPTLQDRDRQVILAVEADRLEGSWSLALVRDALKLVIGKGADATTVSLDLEDAVNRWVRIAGGRGENGASLAYAVDGRWRSQRRFASSEPKSLPAPTEARLVSVSIGAHATSEAFGENPFNGRIENPALFDAPAGLDWNKSLRATDQPGATGGVLAHWDFSLDIPERTVTDTSPNALHGVLVNRPGRGLRSHGWSGRFLRWAEQPSEWAAIHFHEDDLNDAEWETDFSFAMQADTPSGIFALKLRQDDQTEYLPFYVRPQPSSQNRVLFIAPTNTYLAYANDHLGEGERGEAHEKRMREKIVLNETDTFIFEHRELGLSIYDKHADGNGVAYSSWNRPVLNFRPNRITWLNAGRRHFAADFYITGWLDKLGVPFDVATDEDVHIQGAELLSRYDVVVSGSHPEYPTRLQLDAIEAFVEKGGRFMYLGGNGWYWVTSYDGKDTRTLECRRGFAGERNWTSHPSEVDHSSTGERGALYSHQGRSSRLFFGVTSAGVGWGTASGYKRGAHSYEDDVKHLFEGIEDEVLGEFGYILDGAAGDELDSADYNSGTPPNARILMSSRHNDTYFPFLEAAVQVVPDCSGTKNPDVRADVVYIDTGSGGKVFSVGSICWAGSLAYDDYDNNIAALTTNVLNDFLGKRSS